MTRLPSLSFTRFRSFRHSPGEVDPSGAAPHPAAAKPATLDLAAIYDSELDFVWRSLRRLGVSPALLDDAVQDVFLVAHRRLADFEGRSTVRTWLFGIALRVAREHGRRGRKHGTPSDGVADLPDEAAPNPLELAERGEARRLLDALLAELDEDKRAAFILAELEGMSAPEIAAGLGVNVNTLSSRLRAARKQFEAALALHRARSAFPGRPR